MNRAAHDALTSHGWRYVGAASDPPTVYVYAHPDFGAERITVASSGTWTHTNAANANMPARGGTARQLARYLSAIHGTASIADLHLPGRKPDEE